MGFAWAYGPGPWPKSFRACTGEKPFAWLFESKNRSRPECPKLLRKNGRPENWRTSAWRDGWSAAHFAGYGDQFMSLTCCEYCSSHLKDTLHLQFWFE